MTIAGETEIARRVPDAGAIAAPAKPTEVRVTEAARNYGLDALRATMTLLVLFHHTAITYGAPGGWFYREIKTEMSLTGGLLTLFVATNQAYFMGLFFLLAGYFTPAAIHAKGAVRFLGERLLRLGVPLLLFGVFLGPVALALAATSTGHSFTATLLGLWSHGVFIPGPLWFAEALLIFAFAAVLWNAVKPWRAPAPDAQDRFPSNTSLLLAALGTGFAAFLIRLQIPVGKNVLGLQLGYFASYVALFVAGCAAARGRWLTRLPEDQVRTWRIVMWVALVAGPVLAIMGAWLPALAARNDGGWTWPALIYALWEPFVAWGMIMTLLVAFQRRSAWFATPVWRKLAERAYTIYVIHPPVLVALALAWRSVEAPALVKFVLTGTATCLACYLLAGLVLRIPGAKRVL